MQTQFALATQNHADNNKPNSLKQYYSLPDVKHVFLVF